MFWIILIVCVALYIWYRMTHYKDTKWMKERMQGRSDEQKAVIRYFCNETGCLWKKPIKDEEYEQLVINHLNAVDFKTKALEKIGLDEDQVKEIEPVHFEGFQYGDDVRFARRGKDGKYRSSQYQVSWIFFSDAQVYVYQNTFNMDEDGKKERTEEYFYKDITNFSTTSDTVETPEYDVKNDKLVLANVDSNRFVITVPGDRFYCSLEQNDYTERAIQGMKAKLREKKNS